MTRSQFDARFAATQDNTEGYTEAQLREINDAVFAQVQALEVDGATTKSTVDHVFAAEFNAR